MNRWWRLEIERHRLLVTLHAYEEEGGFDDPIARRIDRRLRRIRELQADCR